MRLSLEADSAGKYNQTKVSHKQTGFTTNVTMYVKSILRIKFDIYGELNGFLESLPLYQQDKIYEQYRNVFSHQRDLNWNHDTRDKIQELIWEIKKLYDLVPEEACVAWITDPRSGIRLPPEVENTGQVMHPDMTYSIDEHIKLAGYALALRLMIPIWGEYYRSGSEERETAFKELNAIRLISESWLANCETRNRLHVYIKRVLETSSANATSVTAAFAGIGRDESLDLHLSRVTVRRLPISPISNFEDSDKSTLVSNVYNFIRPTHMTAVDRSFDATVDNKHRLLQNQTEDRSSFTENYKIKERLSAGDSVILSRSLSNAATIAKRIDPTIDAKYVRECTRVVKSHDVSQLTYHQLALLKMVLGITAPPAAVDCVDSKSILAIIAAVQAILWAWGFPSLAAMLTVVPANNGLRRETGQSNRLTKDETLAMKELYPYHTPVGRNFKADEYNKMEKENTTSFIVIRDFAANTESQVWTTSCPEELLNQYEGARSERMIVTPDNIKPLLAALIIKINKTIDAAYSSHTNQE